MYVAALAAYHTLLGGVSLGRDPLVTRFLHGTLRLRPAQCTERSHGFLPLLLEGLPAAPFEPIEEVPEKVLTLKAVLLLSVSSLKRFEDLKALSVAPTHLEFALGMVKAFIHPRPGYVPKVTTNIAAPIVLQAFCHPHFQTSDQENLNLLCPVRALDAYVHKAALFICLFLDLGSTPGALLLSS